MRLTRRRLLAGTTCLAGSAVALPVAAAPLLADFDRGEPFDDGTWFDDGYGWVD